MTSGKRGAMPEAKYPRYVLKRWFADRFETPPSGTPSAGIRRATPTSFACLRGSRPSFAGTAGAGRGKTGGASVSPDLPRRRATPSPPTEASFRGSARVHGDVACNVSTHDRTSKEMTSRHESMSGRDATKRSLMRPDRPRSMTFDPVRENGTREDGTRRSVSVDSAVRRTP